MTLSDYQKQSAVTDTSASFDLAKDGLASPAFLSKAFGLVGEAGEFAEKLKKHYRGDKGNEITPELKESLASELGDVLWYLAAVARYLELDFNQLAQNNLDKVLDRKARGVTKGSGDMR
jgi:NTP pyrophosphatase (non-canonical NTP hydrolase)